MDLPRYETIREDLERILEWNRNVRRVKRVLRDATPGVSPADIAEYRNGPAYRFYLRLRLSSVTDLVATQVAEALNLDPKCAQGDAIRALAGGWRTARLDENGNALFLNAYDREYLQRAIQFLRRQVRSLRKDDDRRQRYINDISEAQSVLHRIAEQRLPDLTRDPATPAVPEPASQRDNRRRDLEFIVDPQFAADLHESQPRLQIPVSALDAGDAGREVRIKHLLESGWLELIDEADKRLREHFKGLQTVRRKLDGVMVGLLGDWTRFDVQDSVVFPVLFGTNVGEVDAIDVIRISPDDVAPLTGVDDDLDPREPKLMGQKFGAFGGFLDRRWRLHDMLRGRLQAAERLITALLPNADVRTRMFRDALIARRRRRSRKSGTRISRIILTRWTGKQRLAPERRPIMRARTLRGGALAVIRRTIRSAQRDPDPVRAARTLTRGTTIVGLMLEDLGDQQPAGKRFGRWVIRAGQIAWGIVELAAPRSLGEVLFQYWVWLIYTLALAMILIGALTDATGVGRVGAIVGTIALAGHALVLALRKWMTGSRWILGFWLPIVLGTTVSSVYLLQAMKATGVTTEIQDLHSLDDLGAVRRALTATIMKERGSSGANTAGADAASLEAEADARFSTYLRDDMLFIPSYTALIIALATGLGYASKRFMARPHAAIALVAAATLATATADFIENTRA